MDVLRPVAVMFCLLFSLTEGNPTGPPVGSANPELCTNMFPAGHGDSLNPQPSTDKFNITLGNDCYKEVHTISG